MRDKSPSRCSSNSRDSTASALLAYPDTLKLLNEMAMGMRIRRHGEADVEEVFDPKTRSERHWKAHIAERRNRGPLLTFDLSHFTDRNVIRLGLTTKCPRCTLANWHCLTIADYVLSCERCSEEYPFPKVRSMPTMETGAIA